MVPTWSQLKQFGQSKAIQSAYIWFFIVPVIASLASKLPPVLEISFLEQHLSVPIKLPFSWYAFYFSSIAFSLAISIYSLKCPRIILRFSSYRDYAEKVGSAVVLAGYLGDLIFVSRKFRFKKLHEVLVRVAAANSIDTEKLSHELQNLENAQTRTTSEPLNYRDILISRLRYLGRAEDMVSTFPREELVEIFYQTSSYLEETGTFWRIVSALFFSIGFILFGFVLAQGLMSVVGTLNFH